MDATRIRDGNMKIEKFSTIYDFSDVPMNRDCFIIRKSEKELFIKAWEKYIGAPDGTNPPHPNEMLDYQWCCVSAKCDMYLDINYCITKNIRFHGVMKRLPRSQFDSAYHIDGYQKRPYIIVDDEWIDSIAKIENSLYAYIDIIGIKKYITEKGKISKDNYQQLISEVDEIADKYENYAFISFADNILIKSNWSACITEYENLFCPEKLILVIKEIREAIKKSLNLDAYAIATQGVNYVENNNLFLKSGKNNHFAIPSIASPFSEIFDIDNKIKDNIRNGIHGEFQLYLSESLAKSMKYKDYKYQDKLQFFDYEAKNFSVLWNRYTVLNIEDFLSSVMI